MKILNEILYKSLREEHPVENMFDFIKNSLLVLDLKHDNCSNFHVYFMIQLSRFLGFYPQGEYSLETPIFDLKEGRFVRQLPSHVNYLTTQISKHFYDIISSSYETVQEWKIDTAVRKSILQAMIVFYQLHLPSFKEIKSQEVLEEVLG